MTKFLGTLPAICVHTLKTVTQSCPGPKILKNINRQEPATGDGVFRTGPRYDDRFLSQSYQNVFPTTYILKFL